MKSQCRLCFVLRGHKKTAVPGGAAVFKEIDEMLSTGVLLYAVCLYDCRVASASFFSEIVITVAACWRAPSSFIPSCRWRSVRKDGFNHYSCAVIFAVISRRNFEEDIYAIFGAGVPDYLCTYRPTIAVGYATDISKICFGSSLKVC